MFESETIPLKADARTLVLRLASPTVSFLILPIAEELFRTHNDLKDSILKMHHALLALAGQKAVLQVAQGGGCSTLFGTMTQTGFGKTWPKSQSIGIWD